MSEKKEKKPTKKRKPEADADDGKARPSTTSYKPPSLTKRKKELQHALKKLKATLKTCESQVNEMAAMLDDVKN